MTTLLSTHYLRCLKKNLNASRPFEHPPVRGGNIKTFRWNQRLYKLADKFGCEACTSIF